MSTPPNPDLLRDTMRLLEEIYHQMLRSGWTDTRLIDRVKARRDEIGKALVSATYARREGEPPDIIFLQWHGDGEPDFENQPCEVSWCAEQIFDHDVMYRRAESNRAPVGAQGDEPRKE